MGNVFDSVRSRGQDSRVLKPDDSKRNVVKSYYIEKRKGGSQISVKTRHYFKQPHNHNLLKTFKYILLIFDYLIE